MCELVEDEKLIKIVRSETKLGQGSKAKYIIPVKVMLIFYLER